MVLKLSKRCSKISPQFIQTLEFQKKTQNESVSEKCNISWVSWVFDILVASKIKISTEIDRLPYIFDSHNKIPPDRQRNRLRGFIAQKLKLRNKKLLGFAACAFPSFFFLKKRNRYDVHTDFRHQYHTDSNVRQQKSKIEQSNKNKRNIM